MNRRTRYAATLGLAGVVALGAASPALATTTPPPPTIVGLALSSPDLSVLVQAVQKAGLVHLLNDPKGNYTVLAPTNAAFVALLKARGIPSLDAIPADRVSEILYDHVLVGSYDAARLSDLDRRDVLPRAVGGLAIDFDRQPAGINNAKVVAADLRASNGVVHVIDAVLTDPDPRPSILDLARTTPSLSTLNHALNLAGLAEVVNGTARFTVFAPTNAAFAKTLAALGLQRIEQVPKATLRAILLDHVVGRELDAVSVGERIGAAATPTVGGLGLRFTANPLQVNGTNIVATDVEGRNGTVHVIDGVLLR